MGAGAVALREVADYPIVVGVPARLVGHVPSQVTGQSIEDRAGEERQDAPEAEP